MTKKPKNIEDAESKRVKKNLCELEQKVNPKPYSREEIEIRKQELLEKRIKAEE